MNDYSDQGFITFINSISPNHDDLNLNNKLNNNMQLAVTLLEYVQQRFEERANSDVFDNGTIIDNMLKMEALKLLDVFISGFTVGRYYEKRGYDELSSIVKGRDG